MASFYGVSFRSLQQIDFDWISIDWRKSLILFSVSILKSSNKSLIANCEFLCSSSNAKLEAINLRTIQGAFYILVAGQSLSLLVLLVEFEANRSIRNLLGILQKVYSIIFSFSKKQLMKRV